MLVARKPCWALAAWASVQFTQPSMHTPRARTVSQTMSCWLRREVPIHQGRRTSSIDDHPLLLVKLDAGALVQGFSLCATNDSFLSPVEEKLFLVVGVRKERRGWRARTTW